MGEALEFSHYHGSSPDKRANRPFEVLELDSSGFATNQACAIQSIDISAFLVTNPTDKHITSITPQACRQIERRITSPRPSRPLANYKFGWVAGFAGVAEKDRRFGCGGVLSVVPSVSQFVRVR